jgi:hypothetical protein
LLGREADPELQGTPIHQASLMKFLTLCLLAVAAACGGASPSSSPSPAPGPSPSAGPPTGSAAPMPMVSSIWRVQAREHVDVWLHSYALLAPDSTLVPFYRRGYRDRMTALRRQRGISSLLDANRDRLLQRIALSPALGTSPQFLPLYFESYDQLRTAIDLFMRASGNPNATNDPTGRTYIAILASAFPTGADREWLRLFAEAVDDESRKFYHDYWTSETRAHVAILSYADSTWQRQRPALQRFLNNTQQQNGELYLSYPLGGEGRTIHFGKQQNAIAVPMPDSRDDADVVLYVMAHEITGTVASSAIEDNTTPAERRAGTTMRYEQAAAVRAGALLLERTVPTVVPAYMRYYLQQAGRTAPSDPRSAFAAAFAMPDAVLAAIGRQLDVILGGI